MGWLDRFLKKGKQAGQGSSDNKREAPSSDLLEYIKTKVPEMQKSMASYRLPEFGNNREKFTVENSKSQTSADITNGGRYHNGTINLEQYQEMQNKYVKGELTFKSIPVDVQQLEVTSAQNIHGVDLFGDKDNMEKFWGQHGRTHEEYLELASHIPEVQKRLDTGEKLENIYNDPEIGACARQYFSPDIMPRVQKYKDTYEMCDGGRHRIIAAQELGLDIPVRVSGEFADNNELNKGNGVDDQKQLRESFKDGQYKEIVTDKEMTLYRVFDGHGALSGGRYYSAEKPADAMQAKFDLALPAEWKNSRLYVEKITIPPGTKVAVGTVAPQRTLSQREAARSAEENGTMDQWQEGPDLPGGAVQVVLEENYLKNHPEIEPEVEPLGFSGNYMEFEKKASELEEQENTETAQVVDDAKMLPPGEETQMLPPGEEAQMLPPGEEAQSPPPEKADKIDLTEEEGEKIPSDENVNRESWEQGRENPAKDSYESMPEDRGPDDGEPPHGQGTSGTALPEEESADAEEKNQTGSMENVELSSENDGKEAGTRPEDNLENVEQSEKPENIEKNQVQSEENQEEKNRGTEEPEEKKAAEGENKTENESEQVGQSGEEAESETENQVHTEMESESVSEPENAKKISGEKENKTDEMGKTNVETEAEDQPENRSQSDEAAESQAENVSPSVETSESQSESMNQAESMTGAKDKTETSGQEDKETENIYMEARADQPEKDIEANNEMRRESGDLPEKESGEENSSQANGAEQIPQQEASEDYSYGYGY